MTTHRGAHRDPPLTLLGRPLPDTVERGVHVLTRGQTLVCDSGWRDVLAVIEQGCIDLETEHRARVRLVAGDVFCPALIGPAVIRGADAGRAVISTVRRVTGGTT